MSKRKKISPKVTAEVLIKSARRCCLCYGLCRDFTEKNGQIAHIDGDPYNNTLDNLVFLCFEHHDQYDTMPSQSKGLTIQELLFYRNILYLDVSTQLPRISKTIPIDEKDEVVKLHKYIKSLRNEKHHQSSLLNEYEIQKVCEQGYLSIEPFEYNNLGMFEYSFSMGEIAIYEKTTISLKDEENLNFPPGQTAFLATREFISIPAGLIGHVSPSYSMSREGLFLNLAGFVNPGFRGRLVFMCVNNGVHAIRLYKGLKIVSIRFVLVNMPPSTVI